LTGENLAKEIKDGKIKEIAIGELNANDLEVSKVETDKVKLATGKWLRQQEKGRVLSDGTKQGEGGHFYVLQKLPPGAKLSTWSSRKW